GLQPLPHLGRYDGGTFSAVQPRASVTCPARIWLRNNFDRLLECQWPSLRGARLIWSKCSHSSWSDAPPRKRATQSRMAAASAVIKSSVSCSPLVTTL